MSRHKIVVTGMGIFTSLGKGVDANHASLQNNKGGITDISILKTKHSGILPCGEIKYTNKELQESTKFKADSKIPRSVLISIPPIAECLKMGGFTHEKQIDFYYATTVGGIDISEDLLLEKSNGKEINHNDFKYHDCGANTDLIADYFQLQGNKFTISTACSSAANAIGRAAESLKEGNCQYALAGGSDALCRFTLNGFNSLMILDKELCRPLDESRKGLNLGEGAAYLLLETEENAISRGAEILGFVAGYSNTNDSHHQTASSEEGTGAYLAITQAIENAGIAPSDISYINAHGTGTLNNDLSEGNAIERVFENVPDIASTKSFTGHTLAASGAIEAVFSLLAILNQEVYPTLRYQEKIQSHNFASFSLTKQKPVNYVLSNAFGFGGNCSALIFSK
ncbi:MAG: beta-ketoacyl-[acyl-carrier-protein] synthase family protein [Saprospiraceae bacterium]|nr:beta-ketoacyl-[acyl-carrier-protein] synthase family protein [Candidatus Brachybacter algidus]